MLVDLRRARVEIGFDDLEVVHKHLLPRERHHAPAQSFHDVNKDKKALDFIVFKCQAGLVIVDLSHVLQNPVGNEGHALHVADLTVIVRVGVEYLEQGAVVHRPVLFWHRCNTLFCVVQGRVSGLGTRNIFQDVDCDRGRAHFMQVFIDFGRVGEVWHLLCGLLEHVLLWREF